MKPSKLSPGTPIEVIWIDTQTPRQSGWMSPEEYAAFRKEPMVMRSVGMFKDKDKQYLGIYGCADMEGEEITLPMAIPIGCIKKIRRLK